MVESGAEMIFSPIFYALHEISRLVISILPDEPEKVGIGIFPKEEKYPGRGVLLVHSRQGIFQSCQKHGAVGLNNWVMYESIRERCALAISIDSAAVWDISAL